MSSRPFVAKMYGLIVCVLRYRAEAALFLQTLRFVQSLPKRERIPFSQKLKTTDPDGKFGLLC